MGAARRGTTGAGPRQLSTTNAEQLASTIQRKVLPTDRRDLEDPECEFPEFRVIEAHTQEPDTAYAVLRNDGLHGSLRPTLRKRGSRCDGGYNAPRSFT